MMIQSAQAVGTKTYYPKAVTAQSQPAIQFGTDIYGDLGASNKQQGNLRLEAYNRKRPVSGGQYHGTVTTDASFQDATHFQKEMAQRILDLMMKTEVEKKLLKSPLKNMVILVPGAIYRMGQGPEAQDVITSMGNLQDGNGNRLTNIQTARIWDQLKTLILPLNIKQEVGYVIPDTRPNMLYANDMMGAAAYIGHEFFFNPQIKDKYGIQDGDKMAFIMTGGGMGLAKMTHHPMGRGRGFVELSGTEKGHIKRTKESKGLEYDAASVHSLISNFAKALRDNLDDHTQLNLKNQVKDFMGQLADPHYKSIHKTFTSDQLKNGAVATTYTEAKKLFPDLQQGDFLKAASSAVDQYLDAIAFLIAQETLEYQSKFVLAGPVLNGVSQFLNDNRDYISSHWRGSSLYPNYRNAFKRPEASKDERFDTLLRNNNNNLIEGMLLQRVWDDYFGPHGQNTLLGMNEVTPFRIISDFELKNNLAGAPYLASAKRAGVNGSPYRLYIKA